MKEICHIYLYGDIVNFQGEDLEYFGCVSLSTFKDNWQSNPTAKEVIVHIHSDGGNLFEALAMYDFLVGLKANGVKITTIVEGVCASAATVVFLAGDSRKLMENCRFLIHNPMSCAEGTAAEIQRVASFLVDEQEKLVEFYVLKTGGDAEQLQALMDEDKFVDADTAIELKFATEVVETMTALAGVKNLSHQRLIVNQLINPQTKKGMKTEKKTKMQGVVASAKTLLKELKALVTPGNEAGDVTATTLTLDDGTEVYYDGATVEVGTEVYSDAEMTTPVEDGDYVYNEGDTMTVVAGVVTVLTPKTAATETDAETIARLTKELEAANATAVENETLADELLNQLEAQNKVLATVKTNFKPAPRQQEPGKPANVAKDKGKTAPQDGSIKEQIKAEKARRAEALKKK